MSSSLELRKIQTKQVPYINKELSKTIYKKGYYIQKYRIQNACKNWRKKKQQQRNYVTKLKVKSTNQYFIAIFIGGPKSKDC